MAEDADSIEQLRTELRRLREQFSASLAENDDISARLERAHGEQAATADLDAALHVIAETAARLPARVPDPASQP